MDDTKEDPVLYEKSGGVATITLNQPMNRNALTPGLLDGLGGFLEEAIDDPDARLCVIANTPPAFCAGADLASSGAQSRYDLPAILRMIAEAAKPVIARIEGYCFGGGIGIAAACDLSVATSESIFAFSEVRVGVAPAIISVFCLPKMSRGDSLELFLTGERFDAIRAQRVGLITRAASQDAIDEVIAGWSRSILLGGPGALAAAKRLIYSVPDMSGAEALDIMSGLSRELFSSPEAAEGMKAFREKRKPYWALGAH